MVRVFLRFNMFEVHLVNMPTKNRFGSGCSKFDFTYVQISGKAEVEMFGIIFWVRPTTRKAQLKTFLFSSQKTKKTNCRLVRCGIFTEISISRRNLFFHILLCVENFSQKVKKIFFLKLRLYSIIHNCLFNSLYLFF